LKPGSVANFSDLNCSLVDNPRSRTIHWIKYAQTFSGDGLEAFLFIFTHQRHQTKW